MKVLVIDCGMGNLGSVVRAFKTLGADILVASEPENIKTADRIVLPGVGAFAEGANGLRDRGWYDPLREAVDTGTPLLGICLGMQLLASRGSEGEDSAGLDLIPGEVVHLREIGCGPRIPHVGWNEIMIASDASRFLDGISTGTDFYFVHSYAFVPQSRGHVLAHADYGGVFPAVVGHGNVMGTQFHPEKSSKAGFRLLKNFLRFGTC